MRRTRRDGPDIISLFILVSGLQLCVPGIAIFAMLPFVDPQAPVNIPAFDRILQAVDVPSALTVFLLTAWFYVFFYAGVALMRLGRHAVAPRFSVKFREKWLLFALACGLCLSLAFFWSLGDSVFSRYASLILFRNQVEELERNAFTANAFALTQTWSWLSVVTLFTVYQRRGAGKLFWTCIAVSASFAILSVSRRALFIPLLMSYLTVVLYTGNWRLRWLVGGATPLMLWLAFGKDILAALAYGGSLESVVDAYASSASAVLRAACEAGISLTESLGTVTLLPIGPRFGIDHLMSIMRLFPEGVMGLDFNFPERVVRLSTEAFFGAEAQDIPPGFLGQMWLDFGVLGPLVWGIIFGLQVALLQLLYARTARTWESASFMALLLFLIAYPVNTGSFDFTFSFDIVVLVIVLYVGMKWRRLPAPDVLPP
jgi:hypothetical protein